MTNKTVYLLVGVGFAVAIAIVFGSTWLKNLIANESRAIASAQSFIQARGMLLGAPASDIPGYKWVANPTLQQGIYLVGLRTRAGDGWTFRVDLDYNDVSAVATPTPNRGNGAKLPIPASRIPNLILPSGSVEDGSAEFYSNCSSCHGAGGRNGLVGPSIAGVGLTQGQVAYMIQNPAAIDPESAMPRLVLSDEQIEEIASYVAQLK